jgi:hypothetical protein
MASRLAEQFPDLSKSIIQTVTATYKNKDEAVNVLRQLSGEPSEQDKHRMLAELGDQYQSLGSETILRVLKEHGWDVDAALVALFNLLSDQEGAPNKQKGTWIHTVQCSVYSPPRSSRYSG